MNWALRVHQYLCVASVEGGVNIPESQRSSVWRRYFASKVGLALGLLYSMCELGRYRPLHEFSRRTRSSGWYFVSTRIARSYQHLSLQLSRSVLHLQLMVIGQAKKVA